MGKARRIRRKVRSASTAQSYCESSDQRQLLAELQSCGLPTEFASTKGKRIPGQPNAEAARTGMIRRYQRFQRKRLKEWQIEKIRGSRISRERKAFQMPK